jgi:hypothetical protein
VAHAKEPTLNLGPKEAAAGWAGAINTFQCSKFARFFVVKGDKILCEMDSHRCEGDWLSATPRGKEGLVLCRSFVEIDGAGFVVIVSTWCANLYASDRVLANDADVTSQQA